MIVLIIAATLRMAIPYILASTGGSFSVRAGITDLGCEGMMIGGAFFGVLGAYFFGNPWMGLLCGALSGLAGVYLSLGQLNMFTEGMTAGRGYICMVINVIGGYNPLGAVWGGCFFAFFEALRTVIQNAAINANFLMMIPYIMTLVAIVISARRVLPPAGMGKHHDD